jgi:hypothetical protein
MKKFTLSMYFLCCIYALQAQPIQELSFLAASLVASKANLQGNFACKW